VSIVGIQNVDLSKELLVSVKGARQRYEAYLKKTREQERSAIELGKRRKLSLNRRCPI